MSGHISVRTSSEGPTPRGPREERKLGTFFSDKTLSDVIVKFGDQEIFAHRLVLVKSSIWFQKALLGEFKAMIDIGGDDDPAAVTAMLRYFYDETYRLDGLDGDSADKHLTMYRLGDLYDAPDLRKRAACHFINSLREDRYGTSASDQYQFPDHIVRSVQQVIGPSADTFADNSIQGDVFKFIIEVASSLYKSELFQELLADGTMFGESLSRRFLQKTGELITRLQSRAREDWGAPPSTPRDTPWSWEDSPWYPACAQVDCFLPHVSAIMANITPVKKRTFFNDEQFSDVIVKFGNQQIFAHKVMLASGSVWFEKALCGNFSEANKKVIELHDEDASPNAIMAMLKHLYGSGYLKQDMQVDPRHVPGFHLEVFTLGDKYDIKTLRSDAAERFERFLQNEEKSSEFWDETIYVIQKVVGPSALQLADQSLAEDTRDFVVNNFGLLFNDNTFRRLMAAGTMLDQNLAYDLLTQICERLS
ncbi:hypothetical protein KCU91_g3115, partial [Aureobasidium melanogenum]